MLRNIFPIFLALLLFGCRSFKEVVIKDKQQWKWDGISITEEVLKRNDFPKNSTIGMFIPTNTINQAIQGIVKTEIRSVKQLKNWAVRIDSIKITPDNGVFFVKMQSCIINPKKKNKLRLDLEAQLNISEVRKSDTAIVLKFELLPISINPYFRIFRLNANASIAASALADLSTIWLHSEEKLSFEFPIKDELNASLSKFFPNDTTKRVFVNKENKDWYFDIRYTLNDIHFKKYLHLNPPAFIKSGIWLSFDLKDIPTQEVIKPLLAPPFIGPQLAKLNKLSDERVDNYVDEHLLNKKQTYLWINEKIIADVFNDLNNLTEKDRTIKLKSIKKKEYIFKEEWKNNILGRGEVSARLEDGDAIDGNVLINSIQSTWKAGQGLDLSLALDIKLHADVHLHVDPYIGGGVGTKIGLESTASEAIKGLVGFSIEKINNQIVILAKTDLGCSNFKVKTLTDPAFKFDYGWTKIPSFGVTMPFDLSTKPFPPMVILSSIPQTQLLKRQIILKSSKDSMVINTPFSFMKYTNTPLSINIEERGLEINLQTDISYTNDSTDIKKEKAIAEQLLANIKSMPPEKSTCEQLDLVVHIGKMEFGSNNDIIKFLNNSWSDIINGPGDNNDIVKVIETVGDLINESTPLDDVTYNFFNEVSAFSSKNLGANNDITKALSNTTNEIDKFRKTPGKAVGDAPGNVIREGKKTVKKLVKKAKRCFGLC